MASLVGLTVLSPLACKREAMPATPAKAPRPTALDTTPVDDPPPERAPTACDALVSRWHTCIDEATPEPLRAEEKFAVDETFARWETEAEAEQGGLEFERLCADALDELDTECEPRDPSLATVLGAAPIGIQICDDYLRKFAVCIRDKLPDSLQATAARSLRITNQEWREVARDKGARDRLERGCATAWEAVRSSCVWAPPGYIEAAGI